MDPCIILLIIAIFLFCLGKYMIACGRELAASNRALDFYFPEWREKIMSLDL